MSVAFASPEAKRDALLAAACTVAEAVRRSLGAMFARELTARLTEPVAWDSATHAALLCDARIEHVAGEEAEAFVAIRPSDAQRLLAAAFADTARGARDCSAIEERVLARALRTAAAACAPICGPLARSEPASAQRAMSVATTYFELRILPPVVASIGFAVAQKHAEAGAGRVGVARLERMGVCARAVVARGAVRLGSLLALRRGTVLTLNAALDDAGVLRVAGRDVAFGTCGAEGERLAFRIERAAASSGG